MAAVQVAQQESSLAAVLSAQPISDDGTAKVPLLGSAPRGSSRDAEGKVGRREAQGQRENHQDMNHTVDVKTNLGLGKKSPFP